MTSPKSKPPDERDEPGDDAARAEADVDRVLAKIGDVLEDR